MSPRDRFLAVTVVAVVLGLAGLTLLEAVRYQHDHDQFVNNYQETPK